MAQELSNQETNNQSPVVREEINSSDINSSDINSSQPWSIENNADQLMDELFEDIDQLLDKGAKLPRQNQQSDYVALKSVVVSSADVNSPGEQISSAQAKQKSKNFNLPDLTQGLTIQPQTKKGNKSGQKQKGKGPNSFKKHSDKILFGVAIACLLGTVGWLVSQNQRDIRQLFQTWQMSLRSEKTVPVSNTLSKSEVTFINYMLKSMKAIDKQQEEAKEARTEQPSVEGVSVSPTGTTIKQVYIPIYTPNPDGKTTLLPPNLSQSEIDAPPSFSEKDSEKEKTPQSPSASPSVSPSGSPQPRGAQEKNPSVLPSPPSENETSAEKSPVSVSSEPKPSASQVAASPKPKPSASQVAASPKPKPSASQVAASPKPKPSASQVAASPTPTEIALREARIKTPLPSPEKPSQAKTPKKLPSANGSSDVAIVLPSSPRTQTYKLLGILESNNRAMALFQVEGTTQRIEVGQKIGNSGWVLVAPGNPVTLRRNGELRSIYVGQSF